MSLATYSVFELTKDADEVYAERQKRNAEFENMSIEKFKELLTIAKQNSNVFALEPYFYIGFDGISKVKIHYKNGSHGTWRTLESKCMNFYQKTDAENTLFDRCVSFMSTGDDPNFGAVY